jgi:hypothetical protein
MNSTVNKVKRRLIKRWWMGREGNGTNWTIENWSSGLDGGGNGEWIVGGLGLVMSWFLRGIKYIVLYCVDRVHYEWMNDWMNEYAGDQRQDRMDGWDGLVVIASSARNICQFIPPLTSPSLRPAIHPSVRGCPFICWGRLGLWPPIDNKNIFLCLLDKGKEEEEEEYWRWTLWMDSIDDRHQISRRQWIWVAIRMGEGGGGLIFTLIIKQMQSKHK